MSISRPFSTRHWNPRTARVVERALAACALACFAVATWDVATGGFRFRALGIRVSSWEAYKPLRAGLLCAVAAVWLHDRAPVGVASTWNRLEAVSRWAAMSLAAVWTVVMMYFGVTAAGGSDAYGYVSQAGLWARGDLVVHDRLAELAPLLGRSVAPLGYQLGRDPGTIVPTYPPGLPIVMAIAERAAGAAAVYKVVPLLGGIGIWLTFVLGTRAAGSIAGLFAACAVALSPIYVFQALQPMSDIPVTTWWLLAWVLAWFPGAWMPLAAGLAASMAVLTRPNLAPVVVVLAALIAMERPRLVRTALFAAGVVPGCALVGGLNAYLYGSPFSSGYGSVDTLFAWSNLGPNLRNYTGWLVELNSPAILLALAAPFATHAKRSRLMLAFAGGLLLSYVFYVVYDNWTYLRFLLPAIPLLWILTAAVIVSLIERLPTEFRGATVLLLVLFAFGRSMHASHFRISEVRRGAQHYAVVSAFLDHALPADAAVITVVESGSIRLYGHRPTLRWDELDRRQLDDAVGILRAHNYVPYILLESSEDASFRARFDQASVFAHVDWPPSIVFRGSIDARLYSLDDRARFLSGQAIRPTIVPVP